MAEIDGPCKNCNERRAACWDKCDKYKSYKAAAEKIKFERRRYEQKERDRAIDISRVYWAHKKTSMIN